MAIAISDLMEVGEDASKHLAIGCMNRSFIVAMPKSSRREHQLEDMEVVDDLAEVAS